MKIIRSRQNKEIKALVKLKMQKERRKSQKFIAEGFNVCKTICQSGLLPEKIYVTENKSTQAKAITTQDNIVLVSDEVMKKISSAACPSGILGLFHIKKAPEAKNLGSGIVLAKISDPGNMGTLIRTCIAMGFSSVVAIECVDPWNPKVVQASAGQIAKIDLFCWTWSTLMKYKKKLKLVALVVKNGKKPNEINLNNSLLVIGSEAHGIEEQWLKDCEEKMTLPMPGKTESLNAAIAGSIALYLAKNQ